ncbi:hypothetical protein O181_006420 [Austropuccinia psidii MF-1]|uniref:Uncharacterized protein n=1 Tax=Austropuccinia psidii MF-1 TaxID=1389203 RepID=A0A9Q3GGU3_9BASI|nr:hypothetical protein [Austropuccinia psidii MF-1]
MKLSATSTSSPSSSSLPYALGSVGETEILLILFATPCLLILKISTSELGLIGLPPMGIGPPTLVHLATFLCLDPVTNEKYQYHNQSRKPPQLQLEYPEVLSGVGASETGNSLPKGPSFLLHKYSLTLESGAPGC